MKDIAVIGIDPGQTGAAVLMGDGFLDYADWPGDPVAFAEIIRVWARGEDIVVALVEKVGAMPGQGVSSMFKFGRQAGMLEGVLAALQIPYQLITPQAWRKGLVMPSVGADT